MKDFLLNLWTKQSLLVILLLGLVLRLVAINQSLWLDESIGAVVVKNESYSQILTKFPMTDNHPPLYYLTLKGWTDVFGYSEAALRGLSVLFGVLTILFVFKLARVVDKGRLFAIVSSLFVATSPLLIYYSQEARMYAMAAFLAVASIYYFLKLFEKESLRDWFFFSFFYTALIFTDYVPIFLYPVFFLYALLKRKKLSWWFKFFVANVPLLLLGYLWLPIFLIQSAKGKWLLNTLPSWKDVAGGATVKQAGLIWIKFVTGRISFYQKELYYSLVFLFSLPFVISLFKAAKKYKENGILWLYLLFPLVFGFFASFWFPAFIYFRFLFVVPAFFMLVAKGTLSFKGIRGRFLVAVILMVNIVGWGIYASDKAQQREDWKGAVNYLTANIKRGDIVVFDYPEPFAPYQWYDPGKFTAVGATDSISANFEKTQAITKLAVKDRDGVYYFNYLEDLTDPNMAVKKAIEDSGFTEEKKVGFNGVGEITYFVRH